MEAIARLLRSGMTRKQIALSIGASEQAVGMLFNGKRKFPSRRIFVSLVNLADSRGINLLARDFISYPK